MLCKICQKMLIKMNLYKSSGRLSKNSFSCKNTALAIVQLDPARQPMNPCHILSTFIFLTTVNLVFGQGKFFDFMFCLL